jgi:hypothetical protein
VAVSGAVMWDIGERWPKRDGKRHFRATVHECPTEGGKLTRARRWPPAPFAGGPECATDSSARHLDTFDASGML